MKAIKKLFLYSLNLYDAGFSETYPGLPYSQEKHT